jgi:ketosteroid isomerase-like protein
MSVKRRWPKVTVRFQLITCVLARSEFSHSLAERSGVLAKLIVPEPMIAISYRREDSMAIAGRLYDRLEAKFGKQNVFMDFDSIRPGFDFRSQIKDTIEQSKVVVAVIGPQWCGEAPDKSRRIDDPTDFVRLEVAHALERGIPVIPVLIHNTPMPKPENLPPDLAELPFRHAVPLDSGLDFRQHADRLIASIDAIVGQQRSDIAKIATPIRRSSRTVLIAGGAGMVLLLIAALAILSRSRRQPNQNDAPQTSSIKNSSTIVAAQNPMPPRALDSSVPGMSSPVVASVAPEKSEPEQEINHAVNLEYKQIRALIQDYYESFSQHDLEGVMNKFAEVVDYQGQGLRSKNYIRTDAANYLKRWDRISFSPDYIDISRNSDGDLVARFDVPYRVGERNAPDKAGVSSNVWILRKNSQGDLEIISQREAVSSNPKRR